MTYEIDLFEFICLMKFDTYSYRTWPHFGDNKVGTGAITEAKRSLKSELKVLMLKISSATSDSKADPMTTIPLHWMILIPNISVWKCHII